MTDLKLIALDGEDLEVISAHVQDAVVRVGDMGYAAGDKRFAFLMNRYAWEADGGKGRGERHRAALSFDRVQSVKISGIDQTAHDGVLELLSIGFEESSPPGGVITLNFAGGGTVRIEVECIEVRLSDGGAAWAAKARPAHQDD